MKFLCFFKIKRAELIHFKHFWLCFIQWLHCHFISNDLKFSLFDKICLFCVDFKSILISITNGKIFSADLKMCSSKPAGKLTRVDLVSVLKTKGSFHW